MKTVKTSELSGRILDYAVAVALGYEVKVKNWKDITDALDPIEDADIIEFHREKNTVRVSTRQIPSGGMYPNPKYHSDWNVAGPIIDKMMLERGLVLRGWVEKNICEASLDFPHKFSTGPTPLIAAMRCFVASKLGDSVEIPEEL